MRKDVAAANDALKKDLSKAVSAERVSGRCAGSGSNCYRRINQEQRPAFAPSKLHSCRTFARFWARQLGAASPGVSTR